MGQELIARKFGHGVHEQEEFNDDEKSVYQLIHAQVGGALNTGDLTRFEKKNSWALYFDFTNFFLQIRSISVLKEKQKRWLKI